MQFPKPNKAAYQKFANPASRYALVGVFVSKRGSDIRVAVTGAGANGVFRVNSFEEALKKRFGAKSLEGMTVPADGMASDIHGSAEYRAHLIGVPPGGAGGAAGKPSAARRFSPPAGLFRASAADHVPQPARRGLRVPSSAVV